MLSGPELPEWLAAPTDDRPQKPSSKLATPINRGNCSRHKQACRLQSSACVAPEAAGPEADNSGAEHLLDIWVSDSDEPTVSSKHRYRGPWALLHRTVTFQLPPVAKSVVHCRMPNAAVLSSSDSEADPVTASWKLNPEDSKPKQRQVCSNLPFPQPTSSLSMSSLHLHSAFLQTAYIQTRTKTGFLMANSSSLACSLVAAECY